jgi:hypothetical protein
MAQIQHHSHHHDIIPLALTNLQPLPQLKTSTARHPLPLSPSHPYPTPSPFPERKDLKVPATKKISLTEASSNYLPMTLS